MVETRTTEADRGLRCSHCGKDLYRCTVTWWIACHGEYCSHACGTKGMHELEDVIRRLEGNWQGRGNKR